MKSNSNAKSIEGFSKLRKRDKIKWIVENFFKDPEAVMHELMSYWHRNEDQQKVLDGFSENTISNFPMPWSVAPNVVINKKTYCVPMVTEESSVVAAASSAAKYWMDRGGIVAEITGTEKLGQIHFMWNGPIDLLQSHLKDIEKEMRTDAFNILSNMELRGGGLSGIEIRSNANIPNYYQFLCRFETCDSMGANFINTCLESFANTFEKFLNNFSLIPDNYRNADIIMSILSNYTPSCKVRVSVSCPIDSLGTFADEIGPEEFAFRFQKAIEIAKFDPYRAVTHNKGILNGVDAVVIATGNDFRAIESCCHAYAARDGQYRSLSECQIIDNTFIFSMEIPLALGTVGGLTKLHPMAKRSLELLENPTAQDLMMITAAVGLMQNFAAVRSLVTTGIQKGHMKMHLENILNHLQVPEELKKKARIYFENRVISNNAVRNFIEEEKNKN